MQLLEVGELVTLEGRYANSSGVATNPTTVTITVTDPAGTVTTVSSPNAALLNPSVGLWTYDLTVNQTGVWTYRWSGTGAVVAGETSYLVVHAAGQGGPRSGPCADWICVDDLVGCSGVPSSATTGQLELGVAAASDLLWRWSGYRWGGLCLDSVRPCAQNEYLGNAYGWSVPYAYNVQGYGATWGDCSCQA